MVHLFIYEACKLGCMTIEDNSWGIIIYCIAQQLRKSNYLFNYSFIKKGIMTYIKQMENNSSGEI